ncbi:DUF7281 domain-containing protein [Halomonas borealis]|uniref:DUF7281 domain-containing protein n=1 Tax=Halomonas borealis TaxID=2508710 RepID=UPI00197A8871|nr:hypothetical protein [Halomonas borealis]
MTALSESARRVLRDASGKLRRGRAVDKPRGPAVTEIVAWCQAWDIEPGGRLTRDRLRFDRALMDAIAGELEVQGEPPLEVALGGLSTAQQAEHGHREAKGVREGPRDSRVLVSLPVGQPPRPGLQGGARECLDVDWRSIELAAFDALVQVENLDSFYGFTPELPALAAYRRPLVVYRGDSHYGGAFPALAEAWSSTGRPHFYAGDFDLKGLDIALGSGATRLLLPALDALWRHATPRHVPAEQLACRPRLLRYREALPEAHPLLGYLSLLLDEQRGLRQQWFATPTVAVELHGADEHEPARP